MAPVCFFIVFVGQVVVAATAVIIVVCWFCWCRRLLKVLCPAPLQDYQLRDTFCVAWHVPGAIYRFAVSLCATVPPSLLHQFPISDPQAPESHSFRTPSRLVACYPTILLLVCYLCSLWLLKLPECCCRRCSHCCCCS